VVIIFTHIAPSGFDGDLPPKDEIKPTIMGYSWPIGLGYLVSWGF